MVLAGLSIYLSNKKEFAFRCRTSRKLFFLWRVFGCFFAVKESLNHGDFGFC